MATVRARGKKGIFVASWWEPDRRPGNAGKLRLRMKSTKTTDRGKASKMAHHWAEAGRSGMVSEAFLLRTVELQRELMGQAGQVTMREFLARWLKLQEVHVKKVTMAFYNGKSKAWLDWLGPLGLADVDMAKIQRGHLEAFLVAERKRVTARTANHTLKFLRAIFKNAFEQRLVVENPVATLKAFKDDSEGDAAAAVTAKLVKEDRRCFTMEELRALLAVCDEEWRSMVMFGYYTGQRLKDIASLRWRQVNVLTREVVVKTSKTRRHTRPAIGQHFHEWLLTREMPDDPEAPVHPECFAAVERTGNTSTLSTRFGDLLAKAGLRTAQERRPKKEERKGRSVRRSTFALSFHCLRHTNTTEFMLAGAPKAVAMDHVGHDSPIMNQIYTHVDAGTKREWADKIRKL